MPKAIRTIPLHADFENNCSLDQQLYYYVKGSMVAVESLLDGIEASYCKQTVIDIITRYFAGSKNLTKALEKVEFFYGKQPDIGKRPPSELVDRLRILAKKLEGRSDLFSKEELEFIIFLAEEKDRQIRILSKILIK